MDPRARPPMPSRRGSALAVASRGPARAANRGERPGPVGSAALAALALVCVAASAVLLILHLAIDTPVLDLVLGEASPAPMLLTTAVGAVIVTRRARNAVGWLLTASGAGFAVSEAAATYAAWGLSAEPAATGAVWAAWAANWLWVPVFTGFFVLLPLLFPDGRLPSPRWRWVAGAWAVLVPLQALTLALTPDPLSPRGEPLIANPLAVPAMAPLGSVVEAVVGVAFLPMLAALVVAVAGRYRRGSPDRRAQLRWFLAAITLVPFGFLASMVPAGEQALRALTAPMFAAVPLAVGVAVLRYRLYAIDRIVSRTLAYATLSVVVAGVYLVAVAGLQGLLRPFAGTSSLAVAGATLAAAGVFAPARRRIQQVVDRRFDRARYDAQAEVEAFREALHQQAALEGVGERLRGAVGATVAPAAIGVWLRREAGTAP